MLLRLILLCILGLTLSGSQVKAQTFAFGFKAGANYSQVSGLSTIILSEPYFINYSIGEKGRTGWHLGIFYEYRLENERLGFQSEIAFSKQGADVEFSNYEKDFNYKMEFAYQYINIVGMAKWFPFKGKASLGAGPFLGINVATRNIKYTSWGEGKEDAFGTDLQQEQQLRNVLRGKNNFGLAVDAAYDITSNLKIGARYYWSGTNVVETQANSYNFVPFKTTNTMWELSLAWSLENMFKSDL